MEAAVLKQTMQFIKCTMHIFKITHRKASVHQIEPTVAVGANMHCFNLKISMPEMGQEKKINEALSITINCSEQYMVTNVFFSRDV